MGLGLLWGLDFWLIGFHEHASVDWVPLLTGTIALWLAFGSERRLSTPWRAALAGTGSAVLTATAALLGWTPPDWGLLETACLLALLVRTCRKVERPAVALSLSVLLGAAVIDEPLRTEGSGITLTYPFLLTFAVGGAIAAGCFLRTVEARRARAVADVRLAERLQLARELHDFVAHHVTGILAQAHAAHVVHMSQPHQVGPILNNIVDAGQQTMDSMRRLIRVLRTDDEEPQVRGSGELHAELTKLVSAFSDHGDGSAARLEVTAAARYSELSPEVCAAIHSVVREALTNVRRHVPGGQATVRLHRTGDGQLRVDVYNTAPLGRRAAPSGGHGGYGLIGLRERAEAVGGTLTAGPTDDDGWWLIAHFPTAGAPTGVSHAPRHRRTRADRADRADTARA
ncbi:histidine kinase [Streptomyces ipomoeae]|jgi:signal transduction histidine kinase|uniref:histidine kinase n=1 Tax=Streptomyces ipomoeae 91-03 TaxID=698759 RepID=L1KU66_9ACTN|nr:histidine kinase [Streptomyces ipomoeae]EKX64089.1 histidine kinase [Streptomyces ipomoeae 91-03]MDX2692011.1 histidine kinase [Streptomyces ipomoeae]MDX2823115.1 histidine kinase [Streptomyces ipomoeae]MDX2840585.1 histidine kinase [Streptomyces ipomoeae]MDX2874836.1 histidine kinase [Streptomyces ipomoeae]